LIGLDSPYMYAAHKTAGGMTSIYRQVGLGCERIVRQVVQDTLSIADDEVSWSYEVPKFSTEKRTLTLDARIDVSHVRDVVKRRRVTEWISAAADRLALPRTPDSLKVISIRALPTTLLRSCPMRSSVRLTRWSERRRSSWNWSSGSRVWS